MLVDPLERRLALEKLLLGNMTMEWSADRQRRQTCGKGQERELHPDDLLGLAERIGAGTETLAMVGARTYKAVGLSQPREGYRTEFYIHLVPANA